jgi:hemerythrin
MTNSSFIVWKEEYEVGHPKFDRHHRRLIEIINRLYNAVSTGASNESLDPIFRDLDDYGKLHFQAEEDLLEATHCPVYEEQRRAHAAYIREFAELRIASFSPAGSTSQEMLEFLKKWWLGHVLVMDKKYSGCLE